MPNNESTSKSKAVTPEVDGARFSQLIIQGQRRMRTLVLAIVPGCRDVDDILQESCAAMWNRIDDYDPDRPFDTWALAFVRLQTMAWLKKAGRDRLQLSSDTIEALCISIEQQNASHYQQHRFHALEDCLAELSNSERDLLISRYVEEMSVQELARQRHDRSSSALYKTFARLQTRLLRCIEGKLKEPVHD